MVFLLDINLLLALAWKSHEHYSIAHRWWVSIAGSQWATCPFTQAGFVRISSNPKVLKPAVSVSDAFDQLDRIVHSPSHIFWADSVSLDGSSLPLRGAIRGHNQITDAYLISLAMINGGKLATMDRGTLSLLLGQHQRDAVTLVR